jgi:hypothetical protein
VQLQGVNFLLDNVQFDTLWAVWWWVCSRKQCRVQTNIYSKLFSRLIFVGFDIDVVAFNLFSYSELKNLYCQVFQLYAFVHNILGSHRSRRISFGQWRLRSHLPIARGFATTRRVANFFDNAYSLLHFLLNGSGSCKCATRI